mmetsp:Transcript_38193/g.100045  ORF Transcript_38193/g.100045 Transcript_38193/m.100045 type:complete len:336 (-) Transcript_38193:12-1019(-)
MRHESSNAQARRPKRPLSRPRQLRLPPKRTPPRPAGTGRDRRRSCKRLWRERRRNTASTTWSWLRHGGSWRLRGARHPPHSPATPGSVAAGPRLPTKRCLCPGWSRSWRRSDKRQQTALAALWKSTPPSWRRRGPRRVELRQRCRRPKRRSGRRSSAARRKLLPRPGCVRSSKQRAPPRRRPSGRPRPRPGGRWTSKPDAGRRTKPGKGSGRPFNWRQRSGGRKRPSDGRKTPRSGWRKLSGVHRQQPTGPGRYKQQLLLSRTPDQTRPQPGLQAPHQPETRLMCYPGRPRTRLTRELYARNWPPRSGSFRKAQHRSGIRRRMRRDWTNCCYRLL